MMLKTRLALMNFLQFAVWGAYLTSIGTFLGPMRMASKIVLFYATQGVISLFMPAIMGIIADRWVPAQRLLGFCHLIASIFMLATGYCGGVIMLNGGVEGISHLWQTQMLFPFYALSVAFYMPTLALSNSVAYASLSSAGMDTVKSFPPIRVFGTVGFIATMWVVDLLGFKSSNFQFYVSALVGLLLFFYTFTLPMCPVSTSKEKKSVIDALGLRAFALFKDRKMATFFVFSMLLGVCLQITNGYASLFLTSFESIPQFAETFAVKHPIILISLSQMSETFCILLIPFFMKRYGIKSIMFMAMTAWVLRFGLLGLGNPGDRLWMLVASMIVYGLAFDLFNISGSLFVDQSTNENMRSSAQGLFMLMTNGLGAAVGMLGAQAVVDANTTANVVDWSTCWYLFAGYAALVAISFVFIFKSKSE